MPPGHDARGVEAGGDVFPACLAERGGANEERRSRELGELVKEQHPVMGQNHLADPLPSRTADEAGPAVTGARDGVCAVTSPRD